MYPGNRLQRCIVHQIRTSAHFVSWEDIKQVTADLRLYTSMALEKTKKNLLQFAEK
ncbi:MAG: hypothetical protein HFF90_07705 [Oscillibacter sp.]|nr:hypothetical protein [Oscillibacter sp.]